MVDGDGRLLTPSMVRLKTSKVSPAPTPTITPKLQGKSTGKVALTLNADWTGESRDDDWSDSDKTITDDEDEPVKTVGLFTLSSVRDHLSERHLSSVFYHSHL